MALVPIMVWQGRQLWQKERMIVALVKVVVLPLCSGCWSKKSHLVAAFPKSQEKRCHTLNVYHFQLIPHVYHGLLQCEDAHVAMPLPVLQRQRDARERWLLCKQRWCQWPWRRCWSRFLERHQWMITEMVMGEGWQLGQGRAEKMFRTFKFWINALLAL